MIISRESLSNNFSEDRSYTDRMPIFWTALDYRFDNQLSLRAAGPRRPAGRRARIEGRVAQSRSAAACQAARIACGACGYCSWASRCSPVTSQATATASSLLQLALTMGNSCQSRRTASSGSRSTVPCTWSRAQRTLADSRRTLHVARCIVLNRSRLC